MGDISADSAYELFTRLMGQGKAAFQHQVDQIVAANPAAHANEIRKMGQVPDLDGPGYGVLGSAWLRILADVLLEMPAIEWEMFYAGFVEWSRRQPRCVYPGKEEENARGAMLLALKYRCEELQRTVARAAGGEGG